ncbi:hypothetical protein Hanom_Chr11g01048121 [Helianthus anomalus]
MSVNVHMCIKVYMTFVFISFLASGKKVDSSASLRSVKHDRDEKDEEKRVIKEDDKENIISVVFNLKNRKNKNLPKKGKAKLKKRAKTEDELQSIRTRTSPNKLYEAVRVMKQWQREMVKEMGFGKLLRFNVSDKDELGHPLKEKWVGRFDKVPISFKNILDKIRLDPSEVKSMFKIDFVTLFISTMIVSTKNGSVMYNMLDWFSSKKEFKDHDWCQLIEL